MTKKYHFLDGVRGIAAICVLIRHTSNFWRISLFRSYLAVDLFFLLSGFVIAYAYEEKLISKAMSVRGFVITRLIRLYPMYVFSIIFCTIVVLIQNFFRPTGSHISLSQLSVIVPLTFLFLPSVQDGCNYLFPLNGPFWSLFYELIINLIYGLVGYSASSAKIIVGLILSLSIITCSALNSGNLDVGFKWGAISMISGLARAAYGMIAGLLIFRHHEQLTRLLSRVDKYTIRTAWAIVALIVSILISPSAGVLNPIIDIIVVGAIFPLSLVILSDIKNIKYQWILNMLGSASYPIYVLHLPAAAIYSAVLKKNINQFAPLSGALFMISLLVISLKLERYYDIPMRKWLSIRLLGASK